MSPIWARAFGFLGSPVISPTSSSPPAHTQMLFFCCRYTGVYRHLYCRPLMSSTWCSVQGVAWRWAMAEPPMGKAACIPSCWIIRL